MKAGLNAHLSSLKKTEEKTPFTFADLRDPQKYLAFVEERKTLYQPIPPGNMVSHQGHHWLHYQPSLTGSADQGDIMVAQWCPSQLCWYHSDQIATMAKPLYGDGLMSHWRWVAYIPVPELN